VSSDFTHQSSDNPASCESARTAIRGSPRSNFRPRIAAFFLICLIALLLGLGGRLWQINTSMREPLIARAQQQRRSTTVVPARRGMIMDRKGRVAAATEFLSDVFVDPSRVTDVDALAGKLAPPLNLSPERIKGKIKERPESHYVVLATRVDEITEEAVRALNEPAVGLDSKPVRTYPLADSMAHVLGWVGKDGGGMEGVELQFDAHLRGTPGRRATLRDVRRRGIMPAEEEALPPADGGHVLLTIDAEIQRITETALRSGVETVEAQSGVAVVMAPGTGEVLAMACYPAFDPSAANDTPAKLRRNQAVTDPTEPGSTFKPFIASGAIEGSYVSLTEQIDCHMGHKFFGGREIKDVKKCGMLDLRGILTYSSNIGMVTIAERMGNPALHNTVRRFGFGEPTGIEYPGEAEGLVRPLKKWGRLSTQSVAMGYEISTTPLQLAAAFSAIVNDGMLLKPRLVSQVLSAEGDVIRDNSQPVVVNRVIASQTAQLLTKDLLASVVEEGSGKHAKLDHYRVCGKSGTAKLPFANRKGYEPGAYMGAFLGAAPVRPDGPPDLSVVVMIRRPDAAKAYYGGAISAPVVGEILRRSLAYLQVPADESMLAQAGAAD